MECTLFCTISSIDGMVAIPNTKMTSNLNLKFKCGSVPREAPLTYKLAHV
jgi:hypothetical protein